MASARYYIGKKDYLASQRYALHSGDAELISTAVERVSVSPVILPLDEFVAYNKIFSEEELPRNISVICPYTYTDQMWYYYFIGNAVKAEYYFDRMQETLPILIEAFPEHAIKIFGLSHYDYRYSITQQLWRRYEIPDIANALDINMPLNMLYLPFIHRGMTDYSELADESLFRVFEEDFSVLPFVNKIIKEGAAAIRSGLLLEQNRLQEALDKADYAKSMIHKSTGKDVAFSIHIHIAAIYAAMGDYDAYHAAVNDTENFITETNAFQFMPNFKAYTTRYHLQRGNRKAADEWLSNYFITEMKEPELYKLYQYITSTRAYIVRGELEKAFEYASKLKKLCEDFRRTLDAAEAWSLLSVIHWKRANRDGAIHALEAALCLLQPHGFIRPVADEGESVLPMLKIFRQNSEKKSYAGKLDSKYIHRVYLAAHEQARRVSGALPAPDIVNVKLTKQQQKIVALLADGCANADMIEITGLTLHTIRTHTMGAYKKLGVDNAADAVLKAKLLGIIEK